MTIIELWLPILIVAIATFVLSFIVWAMLTHHNKDVGFCPQQDELLGFVSTSGIEPGRYMFPNCSDRKDWKNPEVVETFSKGPWGVIDVWPAKPNMGKNMLLTVVYFFIVAIIVGYLTRLAVPAGADFMNVFQVSFTAAILAHVLGGAPEGIWFGKRPRFFLTDAIDGLLYSLATALIFAAMWPQAAPVTTP